MVVIVAIIHKGLFLFRNCHFYSQNGMIAAN
nr:MAG TPA: hypothetical protein [Caudoviricetes sp.]